MRNSELVQQHDVIPALSVGPFIATRTGLVVNTEEPMPFEVWQAYMLALQRVESAIQWVLGDAINYGQGAFGEKYSQALEQTQYRYQTLANVAFVASRVKFSRRRENLSFSHHSEVAALEPAEQDFWLSRAEAEGLSTRELRRQIREHKRQKLIAEGLAALPPEMRDRFTLICGDFDEVAPGLDLDSIDLIITEPPRDRDQLYLFGVLAQHATRLLRPGGSLLAIASQLYLSEILEAMMPHIDYYWMLACLEANEQPPEMWPRRVNPLWKPVLWFVRGEYAGDWVSDVAEEGLSDLIQGFSMEGDVVLDPFCRDGAIGLAALHLNRRFLGVVSDEGKTGPIRTGLTNSSDGVDTDVNGSAPESNSLLVIRDRSE